MKAYTNVKLVATALDDNNNLVNMSAYINKSGSVFFWHENDGDEVSEGHPSNNLLFVEKFPNIWIEMAEENIA